VETFAAQVPSGVDAGIVPDMVTAALRANGHHGIIKAINAHGNLANIPLHTQQVRMMRGWVANPTWLLTQNKTKKQT
jgi:hypothetical protein